MTNGEKILVGIVVIATVITGIIVITSTNTKQNLGNQKSEIDKMASYIDGNGKNNIVENNTNTDIVENEVTNENVINSEDNKNNNEDNKNNNVSNNSVIGKEEQESNNQNTEIDRKQKAIELAKEEWAISVNAYNFEAELQNDGTYLVTVRGKTGNLNAIVTYSVDVDKQEVKDITQ